VVGTGYRFTIGIAGMRGHRLKAIMMQAVQIGHFARPPAGRATETAGHRPGGWTLLVPVVEVGRTRPAAGYATSGVGTRLRAWAGDDRGREKLGLESGT
jgi:hypothetical protein